MTVEKLTEVLTNECGMYSDWFIEDTNIVDGKIELVIYDEYTDAEFVKNDLVLLTDIVEMLAEERVELASYTVEGKIVTAIPA